MPYQNDDGTYEKANKTGAYDILLDPSIKAAIKRWNCSKVTPTYTICYTKGQQS